MLWPRPSFRARRTVTTGAVAALVCLVVGVLFLLYGFIMEAE